LPPNTFFCPYLYVTVYHGKHIWRNFTEIDIFLTFTAKYIEKNEKRCGIRDIIPLTEKREDVIIFILKMKTESHD